MVVIVGGVPGFVNDQLLTMLHFPFASLARITKKCVPAINVEISTLNAKSAISVPAVIVTGVPLPLPGS